MNSQRGGPSQILIWDSTSHRFDLVNPDTSTITCIGITSSHKKKKCTNKIAQHNITDAVSTTQKLLRPPLPISKTERTELFKQLAKATLCQQSHQHYSADLIERWARFFDQGLPHTWRLPSGTQVYDHVSGGGSGSGIKGERQQQTGAQQEQTHGRAGDKRYREEEEARPRAKRRRHCDLPGAAEEDDGEQEESAKDARQSRLDAETRRAVDQANREEAKRQARREKEEMQAQREKKEKRAQREETERAAAAEAKRTAELQAEQQRRDRDRAEHDLPEEERAEKQREDGLRLEARQRHERNAQQPWSDAWATFGEACSQLEDLKTRPAEITDLELYTMDFWPTRVGSYESCTLDAVKEFFDNPATVITRKIWLKLAWLWHPDRSMRHFSHSKDGEAIRDKLTMVTAVITSKLETY
jgi:hypothetical protein